MGTPATSTGEAGAPPQQPQPATANLWTQQWQQQQPPQYAPTPDQQQQQQQQQQVQYAHVHHLQQQQAMQQMQAAHHMQGQIRGPPAAAYNQQPYAHMDYRQQQYYAMMQRQQMVAAGYGAYAQMYRHIPQQAVYQQQVAAAAAYQHAVQQVVPAKRTRPVRNAARWATRDDDDDFIDDGSDDSDDEDYSPSTSRQTRRRVTTRIMSDDAPLPRARTRRRARSPRSDYVASDDSSDEGWTRGRRKTGGKNNAADVADDDSIVDDSIVDDDDDDMPVRKRTELSVLDLGGLGQPKSLTVDRVVGHQDFWWDPGTDEYIEIPTGLPQTPSAPPVLGVDAGAATAEVPSTVTDLNTTEVKSDAVDQDDAKSTAERTEKEEKIAGPISASQPPRQGLEVVRKFWIKWKGLCNLRNELYTWDELNNIGGGEGAQGIKKVSNYMRKQEELEAKKQMMTEDEIEQLNINVELQQQIDQDTRIPERIVTHRVVNTSELDAEELAREGYYAEGENGPIIYHTVEGETPEAAAERLPRPPETITVYLIKWTSSPYDQCTWESEKFLTAHSFQDLIQEYLDRESRISGALSADHPLNLHNLGDTSFEPYTSTPHFLGKNGSMELRDYQLTGLNWMVSSMKKDLSVLLADEMGLGKTAQTVSVIGHILYCEKISGPILVIVPQSTMDNWLNEFKQWLPDANVVLYHGNPQAREILRKEELKVVQAQAASKLGLRSLITRMRKNPSANSMTLAEIKQWLMSRTRYRCDVVVTTPSILQSTEDLVVLKEIRWYLMAIDEAHQLKNRESKRFKQLCMFQARYKLLLSGTPLQNKLDELWSLLHFMNPDIYPTIGQFRTRYSEIEKLDSVGELKTKQLSDLQHELSEVILRRVKKDVLKSLPSKNEWILRVQMSPKQTQLCKDVVARNYSALEKSTGASKLSLQNICVELKKICNHPFLIHSPEERAEYQSQLVWSSGKMCLLDQLLDRLRQKGHRVLIFSQMVRMLNILSAFLTSKGYRHQRLDGTMSRDVRKKAMDHFNAPGSEDFCFLLSTKAGGLGINLTSADTVIIYDSDWNPQNDLQAEARAHRIGQTKTVQIYRVVTKDSVEEEILERAKTKMVLDTLVVQGLNVKNPAGNGPDLISGNRKQRAGFTPEELSKILKFGARKLWDKEGASADSETGVGINIDLDNVLAEAEHESDEMSGREADLLNSFSNVSDFRYEAPKGKQEEISWDEVVPLEERLKYMEEEPAPPPTSRARKGRTKRQARPIRTKHSEDDDDGDEDFVDEDSDAPPKRKSAPRRKTTEPVKKRATKAAADPLKKERRPRRKTAAAAAPAEEKKGE